MTLFLTACAGDKIKEATWPKDLAAKKKFLKEKKSELKALTLDIDKLKNEISELDTSNVAKSKKLVTIEQVATKDFDRFVEIQATVQSDNVVSVSSETGGRLIAVNAKEGDPVRKGQLIAKVDMESLNKQIAEVETSLSLAKDVYERQSRLWKQEIGSEMQYLQAKNQKERLEKSLETIRHSLTKANVYAPISGVVDRLILNAGEMSSPGMPIVQILNIAKVKVVAEVPENYLQSIRKGDWVDIKFPALDLEKKGKVTLLGSSINPANRTFSVEVDMVNGDGALKPNLLASMVINEISVKNAIVVPLELVQQEVGGKNFVYIKKDSPEGLIAEKVFVETGESSDTEIVVTEGLTGEEFLIIEGARGLAENELIEIEETVESVDTKLSGNVQ